MHTCGADSSTSTDISNYPSHSSSVSSRVWQKTVWQPTQHNECRPRLSTRLLASIWYDICQWTSCTARKEAIAMLYDCLYWLTAVVAWYLTDFSVISDQLFVWSVMCTVLFPSLSPVPLTCSIITSTSGQGHRSRPLIIWVVGPQTGRSPNSLDHPFI